MHVGNEVLQVPVIQDVFGFKRSREQRPGSLIFLIEIHRVSREYLLHEERDAALLHFFEHKMEVGWHQCICADFDDVWPLCLWRLFQDGFQSDHVFVEELYRSLSLAEVHKKQETFIISFFEEHFSFVDPAVVAVVPLIHLDWLSVRHIFILPPRLRLNLNLGLSHFSGGETCKFPTSVARWSGVRSFCLGLSWVAGLQHWLALAQSSFSTHAPRPGEIVVLAGMPLAALWFKWALAKSPLV